MDDSLSRARVSQGRVRSAQESSYSKAHRLLPPEDPHNMVYFSLLLSGAGFLLPYNSFISAVDYLHSTFPGSTIVFDISLIYIMTALLTVLLNNVIMHSFSLNSRIMFGYLVSLLVLLFLTVGVIWLDLLPGEYSYGALLVSVALVSVGATIQQSSFYGLTSMLPSRYTQAVMTGESTAGLLASLGRILTKALLPASPRAATALYFCSSIVVIILCILAYLKVQSCPLVLFYRNFCSTPQARGRREGGEEDGQYQTPADDILENQGLLSEDEYYQVAQGRIKQLVADTGRVARREGRQRIGGNVHICCRGLAEGARVRLAVCSRIWPYMLAIALNYLVTLALFPGMETEVGSCSLGDWMPVILMAVFNLTDLMGKVLAGRDHSWSQGELVLWPLARSVLIPLLVLCALPRYQPVFQGEMLPLGLTAVLGLTNGLFGSLPMIQAPRAVGEGEREVVGNLMTAGYCTGLTLGSLVSYWLDSLLGSPLSPHTPCPAAAVSPAVVDTVALHRWNTPLGLGWAENNSSWASG